MKPIGQTSQGISEKQLPALFHIDVPMAVAAKHSRLSNFGLITAVLTSRLPIHEPVVDLSILDSSTGRCKYSANDTS